MGASLFTRGLAPAPGGGPEGAGVVAGRKDSVLSSLLRSRPDTLGTAPVLASDFSPTPEPLSGAGVKSFSEPTDALSSTPLSLSHE